MQALRIAGFLWLLTWFSSEAHAGASKLQLRPAIPMGYAGEILRLQVKLPCGSRYVGLVARGDSQGKVLEVAAAVTDTSMVCTSMPMVVEVGADFLATRRYKNVAPMAIIAGTRVHAVSVEELRIAATPTGHSTVHAIYTKHCGRDLGTLIRRTAGDRLEVAMLEESVSKDRAASCLAAPSARRIPWIAAPSKSRLIKPMLPSSRSFAKQFDLILAPIVSIESSRGGASVTYQRRCNEAPIGLVVGANSMSQASVGVLVASYPNLRCQAELPHAVSETMIEPALRFPSKISLVPMRQQPNVEASLRAPSELTLENGSKGSNLRISYIDSCQLRYAIYARDASGRLAVGTLALAPSSGVEAFGSQPSCVREPSKVEMVQPFLAANVDANTIYPLRMRGI